MIRSGGKLTAVAGLAAAAALWIAPQASAAITGSQMTTPTGPVFGIHGAPSPITITVSGTTTGGVGSVDQVDIVCTNADGSDVDHVLDGVLIDLDGTFSEFVNAGSFNFQPCILRAYPAGIEPADPSPFGGPLAGFGFRSIDTIGGGPNVGDPSDFYIWAQGGTAAFDYTSVSSCGVCTGYLFNSNLDQTAQTFFRNAYLTSEDTNSSPTRSAIQVDGVDAYAVTAAAFINSQADPGFPALTNHTVTQNASTGDTTITESNGIVKCGEDTSYPPDDIKCDTFVDTGVRLDRTIVQDHDGRLATVTDTWVSTDATAHSLDLLPQNEQLLFPETPADPAGVAYQFPGEAGYSTHAIGDVVDFGGGSPGAVYINRQGSPDGATDTGQGAIVFDHAANPATFITPGSASISAFHFHQTAIVPMGGSTTLRTAYAQAYTCAEVASLAQAAAASFGGSVTPPACPSQPTGGGAPPATSPTGPTGKRARALKKCKKIKNKAKRKKCRKRAKKLPV